MSASKFSKECVDLLLAGLLFLFFYFFFFAWDNSCVIFSISAAALCVGQILGVSVQVPSLFFNLFKGAVLLCLLELGQLVSPSLTLSLLLCSCQYGDFGLFGLRASSATVRCFSHLKSGIQHFFCLSSYYSYSAMNYF